MRSSTKGPDHRAVSTNRSLGSALHQPLQCPGLNAGVRVFRRPIIGECPRDARRDAPRESRRSLFSSPSSKLIERLGSRVIINRPGSGSCPTSRPSLLLEAIPVSARNAVFQNSLVGNRWRGQRPVVVCPPNRSSQGSVIVEVKMRMRFVGSERDSSRSPVNRDPAGAPASPTPRGSTWHLVPAWIFSPPWPVLRQGDCDQSRRTLYSPCSSWLGQC